MSAPKKRSEEETIKKYIDSAYEVILNCILDIVKGDIKSLDIKVKYKMMSRRIHLHMNGRDLILLITKEGHIDLELKEASHEIHKERLYEYSEDLYNQNDFLDLFEEYLTDLIEVFLDKDEYNFHTFMDQFFFTQVSPWALSAYLDMVEMNI